MPYTWNTINTHAAGDVLPLADWNQAATALNSMAGTWSASGIEANANVTPTPPFYVYMGSSTQTTSSAVPVLFLPVPNGGFPNGVIYASAIAQNTAAYAAPINQFMQPAAFYMSKTSVSWYVTNASFTYLYNTSVFFNFFVIGY